MKRRSQSGLTMVEITVVLAIVALLAAAAYPLISNVLQVTAAKGASEQLASAIRLARQYAITKGTTHCIKFTAVPGTQFSIKDTSSNTACDGLAVDPTKPTDNVGQATVLSATNLTGDKSIVFDSIGTVVSSGGNSVTLKVGVTPCSASTPPVEIQVSLYGGTQVSSTACP